MSNTDPVASERVLKEFKSSAKIFGLSAGFIQLLMMAHFFYKPITNERFFNPIDSLLSSVFLVSTIILVIKFPKMVSDLNAHFTDNELKKETDQLLGYDSNKLTSSIARLPILMIMVSYLYLIYYVSFIKGYNSYSLLSVGLVVLISLLFTLWKMYKNLLKPQ